MGKRKALIPMIICLLGGHSMPLSGKGGERKKANQLLTQEYLHMHAWGKNGVKRPCGYAGILDGEVKKGNPGEERRDCRGVKKS